MVFLETLFQFGGDILPNWGKLGFFFAKMGFQFGKMRFEFVPMPFFRRPQQTHAQGKRMVVVTRKPDKGGMSFQRFHDFELQ